MAEGDEGDERGAPGTKPEDAGAVASATDVTTKEVRPVESLDETAFGRFLVAKATQEYIRAVFLRRLKRGAPPDLIEDLVQQASLNALEGKTRPTSLEKARGWIGVVAARTLARHFRTSAVREQWLDREVEVESLENVPSADPSPEAWSIQQWLVTAIGDDVRDQETYELLRYKAERGRSWEQVAADHAMTEGALKSRVHAFKRKYEPRWQRRREMMFLWILFGAAGVIAAAVLLWWLLRPAAPVIGPDVEPTPVPVPAPTATDERDNRALPPVRPKPPSDRKVVP
jgi:DNA-directed RNA polymerase specialized sigma24 family protein